MKNAKKTICDIIAKVGMNIAVKAAGSASTFSYHQPKEPKILKSQEK